ncbi:DUF4355 domain-containing protein [Enterococcus sp.]|uniref:DUF4355 domain-containing protein n=1 Tax=Enterococcus sp. TaxID=35783 RepID=UPI0028973BF0|nr:DUF4355 domain-containing protein [Enterococcus sp.]
MTFNESKSALEGFKDTQDYKDYIAGLITDDSVKTFLDTDAGKKLIQPIVDKNFNKGLETWKSNNLSALVDAEVAKRNPGKDPKDIEIEKMQQQIAELQAADTKKALTIKAQSIAAEKKLPSDLVSYFIGSDEDTTTSNIDTFSKTFSAAVDAAVSEKLKDTSYVPPDDKTEPLDGVTRAFMELNPALKING